MDLRRLIPKFGILLVILMLIGLLVVAPVAAQVEPLAVSATINPHSFANDGASVATLTWGASGWTNYAAYYTIEITKGGSPVYKQYSNDPLAPGPNDFPGLSPSTLPGIAGTNPAVGFTNPAVVTWTVPAGLTTGVDYQFHMKLWERLPDLSIVNIVGSYEGFTVTQATGNLDIHKIRADNLMPLSGWHFTITGPQSLSGNTGPSGNLTFMNIKIGSYTITETLQPLWDCIDPGPSLQKPANVPFNGTATVTFSNKPQPGTLLVHKTTSPAPTLNGGWEFKIYGPDNPSTLYSTNTTVSGLATFNNVPAGQYTIKETLKAGWYSTDPGGSTPQKVDTVYSGVTTDVYFSNAQTGSLKIIKYNDANENDAQDPGENNLSNPVFKFKVTGPSGTFDNLSIGPDGTVTVSSLIPGSYTIEEKTPLPTDWSCTDSDRTKTMLVVSGDVPAMAEVKFGNYHREHIVPSLGQWGIIAMSGLFGLLLVMAIVRNRRSTAG